MAATTAQRATTCGSTGHDLRLNEPTARREAERDREAGAARVHRRRGGGPALGPDRRSRRRGAARPRSADGRRPRPGDAPARRLARCRGRTPPTLRRACAATASWPARCAWSSVQRPRFGDHLVQPPGGLARARRPGARRRCVRRPRGSPRHSRKAADRDELRRIYRRLLLRLAARDLSLDLRVEDAAAELADLAAGAIEGGLAIARRRGGRPTDTLHAQRHRHGQVRGPRAQLRQRRRRHLRRRAGRRRRRDRRAARRHGVGVGDDARSVPTTPARARCGRSTRGCGPRAGPVHSSARSAATRPTTSAGPRRGSSRRCSRPGRSPATPTSVAATWRRSRRMVWEAAGREDFVTDVQAMRRRVVDHIPAEEVDRQLKLGPGGLRDIEFAVQLLQLVHGRSDRVAARRPTRSTALEALTAGGYVGRDDGAAAGRGVPLPADARAPTPAEPPAAYARDARRPAVAARARSLDRADERAGEVADRAVEAARARGTTAAREALLPPAAGGGRGLPEQRGPAHDRSGPATARGARLRRPRGRAASPRGADLGCLAPGRDPAHAAAGHARLVRRRARPRRRAAGLPTG